MKKIFSILFTTLFWSVIILFALPQNISAKSIEQKINHLINSHVSTPNPFSGSVLVARAGKIEYRGAFGQSAFNSKVKNSIDSKYFIGSITKQFTTIAILQLVEQKKISLSDKLSTWLPELSNANAHDALRFAPKYAAPITYQAAHSIASCCVQIETAFAKHSQTITDK